MKIYIVEDEKTIASALAEELSAWGYSVFIADKFNDIIGEFLQHNPDLVLMDISLPYFNGYYWTQKIRENSNVPIVFISSCSEDMNIMQAMQLGADEFISKPINVSIACAKIRAILRRTYEYAMDGEKLIYKDLALNVPASRLEYGDLNISLSKTELMILYKLFVGKGNIVSREQILDYCWQGENFIDDNTLAVNITRIRKKLADIGLESLIQSKRGVGYFLESNYEK